MFFLLIILASLIIYLFLNEFHQLNVQSNTYVHAIRTHSYHGKYTHIHTHSHLYLGYLNTDR